MSKPIAFLAAHKILVGLVIIAAAGGGYWWYVSAHTQTSAETRYVTAAAAKGTVIVAVSGTGQVSASDQVDLKPKASGEITFLGVVAGQQVKAGTVVARIDARDAVQAVHDAQTALETAQLSLDKLKQPADALSALQEQNALAQAQENVTSVEAALGKSYIDGFAGASSSLLDLSGIMNGLNDVLYGTTFNGAQANIDAYGDLANKYDPRSFMYRDAAAADFKAASDAYDGLQAYYKTVTDASSQDQIEKLIADTGATAKLAAVSARSAMDLIQFYKDRYVERSLTVKPLADTHLSTLASDTNSLNVMTSSMTAKADAISNARQAIVTAQRSLAERQATNAKQDAGTDPLDLRAAQISVDQRAQALSDAKITLADYVVLAPFDGTVASVAAQRGDTASSGTTIATLITPQRIASVSLNEVDAAAVKQGQHATLTFDAIPDFTLTGVVSEVATIGTVSQGVVSYEVKIAMDIKDDRIKPGMTVTADIITDSRQDVMTVPSSAVKAQGTGASAAYVEILDGVQVGTGGTQGVTSATAPRRQQVQTGLVGSDVTEIVSGLSEGDVVVTRTIAAPTSAATTGATQSRSILNAAGAGAGGGARIGGGGFGGGAAAGR